MYISFKRNKLVGNSIFKKHGTKASQVQFKIIIIMDPFGDHFSLVSGWGLVQQRLLWLPWLMTSMKQEGM